MVSIFDLHNDLYTSKLSCARQKEVRRASPSTVVYAMWTSELPAPMAFLRSRVRYACDAPALFAVEDLGFVSDEDCDEVLAFRPLYCSLTHNAQNRLAGGALSDGMLTVFGASVLEKMNAASVAVDGAHLNRKSFYAVADRAERFLVSHSGLDAVCRHPRNLTDRQVRVVLERGGVVGLTAVRDFLGAGDASAYVRLIDTFVQTYGIDGASIGTDFYGTKPLRGLRRYEDLAAVGASLLRLGYTEQDVERIFYTNAKNYFHI